jgi:hypothetical protein
VAQDTIDLCGHCGLGRKAVTHFCEVDKPLKHKDSDGKTTPSPCLSFKNVKQKCYKFSSSALSLAKTRTL